MEPDVQQRFDRLDTRLAEIDVRLGLLDTRFEQVDVQLDQVDTRLAEMETRLTERMRDMQTELLKAFLPWQEQVRIQFRELEVNTGNSVQAVKLRMDVLERRLDEIEKRLLMEPPAA